MTVASFNTKGNLGKSNEISAARFYQLEGLLGTTLPQANTTSSPQVRLLGGIQIWGMIVPDASYGVRILSGPQAGFEFSGELKRRRSWKLSGYLAPVSEKFLSFKLHDFKTGFAGAYELTDSMSSHPVEATLNLDWVSLKNEDGSGFQSFAPRLGVRVGF